jgi:hypothetical protein
MKGFHYVYILASETNDEVQLQRRDAGPQGATYRAQSREMPTYSEAQAVENRNGSRIPFGG